MKSKTNPEPQRVIRISEEVYEAIEQRCKQMDPGSSPNALGIAYALGQQSVLKILRQDLVVPGSWV